MVWLVLPRLLVGLHVEEGAVFRSILQVANINNFNYIVWRARGDQFSVVANSNSLYVETFVLVKWIAQNGKNSVGQDRNSSNQTIFSPSNDSVFIILNHTLDTVWMSDYSIVTVTKPIPTKNVDYSLRTSGKYLAAVFHEKHCALVFAKVVGHSVQDGLSEIKYSKSTVICRC